MTKLDELKKMIEDAQESIEDAKERLKDYKQAQIEAEAELEQLEYRLGTLCVAREAIVEVAQSKDDMFREILNELAVKATAGGITIADIKTAAETAEIKLDGVFEPSPDEEEAQEELELATG